MFRDAFHITYLLGLLDEHRIFPNTMIISQDANTQRRMEAGFKKHVGDAITVINYATYSARVTVKDGVLAFTGPIHGMWKMDRYISLLLGVLSKLTDDAQGYGPNGKGYIAHVDIPGEMMRAFAELKREYAGMAAVRLSGSVNALPTKKLPLPSG